MSDIHRSDPSVGLTPATENRLNGSERRIRSRGWGRTGRRSFGCLRKRCTTEARGFGTRKPTCSSTGGDCFWCGGLTGAGEPPFREAPRRPRPAPPQGSGAGDGLLNLRGETLRGPLRRPRRQVDRTRRRKTQRPRNGGCPSGRGFRDGPRPPSNVPALL